MRDDYFMSSIYRNVVWMILISCSAVVSQGVVCLKAVFLSSQQDRLLKNMFYEGGFEFSVVKYDIKLLLAKMLEKLNP